MVCRLKHVSAQAKYACSELNNSCDSAASPASTVLREMACSFDVLGFNFLISDRRGVLDAAALQALAGESVLEKERQLSEMILQLQMVREQLLAQQEHAKCGYSLKIQCAVELLEKIAC
ncbi:hypothetical protein EVAR_18344_1 [Eumeta japonica]|uniref:Uncharacterized protein n=1 Tax=Eumeta variegata TaxID=151549 RepID=A0A4C1V961_EUMVA|nr:hypothetical protein EVAR_18344_1 [Eumeta japonica]